MKQLFISYSRENHERAKALAEDLDALGHAMWLDQNLTGGQAWWNEILEQIRACDVFLFALSAESLASAACRLEVNYGLSLRKTVLPVLVADGVSTDLLPAHLGHLQIVDYRQSDKAAVVRLAKTLNALPPSPPLPEPLPEPPAAPLSYLGGLREELESSSFLKFEEQTAILVKLKQALREKKKPDDVRTLLAVFRNREDLLARVADEIDEVLGGRQPPQAGASRAGRPRAGTFAGDDSGSSPSNPMLKGIDELMSRVRICFGPGHRPVVVPRGTNEPLMTGRAADVLAAFVATDPAESAGAKLIQEHARGVLDWLGTGGATTALLAQAILRGGLEALATQPNPGKLTKSIEAASRECVERLRTLARKADQNSIAAAASVASWEVPARMVVDAIGKVGHAGPIVVEERHGQLIELFVVSGMQFDRGYLSESFITDAERREAVLEHPLILMCDKEIADMRDLAPVLAHVEKKRQPLLIIAANVEGEALETLVRSKLRGTLEVVAVKPPGFGDNRIATLKDIAILTNGRAITKDLGVTLENVKLEDLGRARKVIVRYGETTIIEGAGTQAAIAARIAQIRPQVEASSSDYDREKLQERLNRLAGGVAVIGTQAWERRDVENALRAARAAIETGVVAGGGVALLRAAEAARKASTEAPPQTGIGILRRACEEPLRQLATNGGEDPDRVIAEVLKAKKATVGFNAETGEVNDLVAANIVDSLKSTQAALEGATTAAVKLLWSSMA